MHTYVHTCILCTSMYDTLWTLLMSGLFLLFTVCWGESFVPSSEVLTISIRLLTVYMCLCHCLGFRVQWFLYHTYIPEPCGMILSCETPNFGFRQLGTPLGWWVHCPGVPLRRRQRLRTRQHKTRSVVVRGCVFRGTSRNGWLGFGIQALDCRSRVEIL